MREREGRGGIEGRGLGEGDREEGGKGNEGRAERRRKRDWERKMEGRGE